MPRYSSMSEVVRVLKQETAGQTQRMLVETAKSEHRKVMNDQPAPSSFVRIVDGAEGAREEAVKADGVIIYQYSRIVEVVQFAMDALFDVSPVLSGDYRSGHTLIVNGRPVASIQDWKSGDDLVITNTLPYSRKIEVGTMKMRVAGSSKVYQQARRLVMARYGNMVSVEFTYRAFVGGLNVNQAKAASSGKSWWLGHSGDARSASGVVESTVAKKHGKSAHNASDVRFPCLVIRER